MDRGIAPWKAPDLILHWERICDFVSQLSIQAPRQEAQGLGEAMEEARRRVQNWASLPFKHRATLLRRAAATIEDQLAECSASLVVGTGRPWWLALREAIETARRVKLLCDELEATPTDMPSMAGLPSGRPVIKPRLPLGVWIIIPPDNSPLFLPAVLASAALLGGNTVILLPSSAGQSCAQMLVDIMLGVGIPRGVIQIFSGPMRVLLDGLSEAGSLGVCLADGRELPVPFLQKLRKPGFRLFHLANGRSSVLVLDDHKIQEVAREIAIWSLAHSGQVVGSPELLLVYEHVFESFKRHLVKAMGDLQATNPTARDAVTGPLIDPEGSVKLDAWRRALIGHGEIMAFCQHIAPTDQWVHPLLWTGPFFPSVLNAEVPYGGLALCPVASPQEALEIVRGRQSLAFMGIYNQTFLPTDPRLRGIPARGVFINGFPGPENLALAGEYTEHEDVVPLMDHFLWRQTLYPADKA